MSKDGGPAFGYIVGIQHDPPRFDDSDPMGTRMLPHETIAVRGGMSKLELFAAALLTGLAASGRIPFRTTHQTSIEDEEERANDAAEIYDMAESMLAESERRSKA